MTPNPQFARHLLQDFFFHLAMSETPSSQGDSTYRSLSPAANPSKDVISHENCQKFDNMIRMRRLISNMASLKIPECMGARLIYKVKSLKRTCITHGYLVKSETFAFCDKFEVETLAWYISNNMQVLMSSTLTKLSSDASSTCNSPKMFNIILGSLPDVENSGPVHALLFFIFPMHMQSLLALFADRIDYRHGPKYVLFPPATRNQLSHEAQG